MNTQTLDPEELAEWWLARCHFDSENLRSWLVEEIRDDLTDDQLDYLIDEISVIVNPPRLTFEPPANEVVAARVETWWRQLPFAKKVALMKAQP